MNTNILTGHWGLVKTKLKEKYSNLTENDLAYVKDRELETLERIREKTGASRDEIERFIHEACLCPP